MLSDFVFLAAGLAILLLSGDVLARASMRFAILLKVPPLVAGLTITAFATSAPEAVIGISAALNGATDIVLGNVIGSNIANILFVLGLSTIFLVLGTNITQMRRHFLMMLLANFLLLGLAFWGEIYFFSGLGLLSLMLFWLIYSFKTGDMIVLEQKDEQHFMDKQLLPVVLLGLTLAGVGLWAGASLTLKGAQAIASAFNVSQAVIGLTLIAIGTSLPELATSIAALWRRHADIALGNILGSNLLNIFFVLGLSALITTIPIPRAFLLLDLPVMVIASLLLMPFVLRHNPLTRWVGLALTSLYALYIWSLVAIRPEIL